MEHEGGFVKPRCLFIHVSCSASRSHSDLLYEDTVLAMSDKFTILGFLSDAKLIRFNTTSYRWLAHLRELGIHRKAYIIFQDTSISASCSRCIILPLYEYYAQVWSSVAVCHLHLLHRVVRTASFL